MRDSLPIRPSSKRGPGGEVNSQPFPIHVLQASMDILPFPSATFDVVICALATGHLPPAVLRRAIMEMARVLSPGGEVLISDFHPALYALGGRRTLIAPDGQIYAVEHYPHTLDDYRDAVAAAGLRIVALAEPQAEFQRRQVEAVLVLKCQKL
ncbi:MAG TPA: class I SAM-dependent methyltransferase [Aggregatilineales bacterium]|nr:class I SAM-dependent methyltransferase [Aggregatilineales bacterium]